jgi:hypothetical protein
LNYEINFDSIGESEGKKCFGPCKSLIGGKKYYEDNITLIEYWGPLGWWIAILTVPLSVASLILSLYIKKIKLERI